MRWISLILHKNNVPTLNPTASKSHSPTASIGILIAHSILFGIKKRKGLQYLPELLNSPVARPVLPFGKNMENAEA